MGICKCPGQRQIVGYVSLLLVILTWVSQSELAQFIQVGSYNKPYLLTWFNHGVLVLLLPVSVVVFRLCGQPRYPGPDHSAGTRPRSFNAEFLGIQSWWRFAGNILALAFVLQLADYTWYLGLPLVSVTVGTVLFNASCVFTYLIMLCFCMETHLSVYKSAGILLTVGGVLMVSDSETDNKANNGSADSSVAAGEETVGKVFILLGALGYSVFEVLVSRVNEGAETARLRNLSPAPSLDAPVQAAVQGLETESKFESARTTTGGEFDDLRVENTRRKAVAVTIATSPPRNEIPELGSLHEDRGNAMGSPSRPTGRAEVKTSPTSQGNSSTDMIVFSCFLSGMMGLMSITALWPGLLILNALPADSMVAEPFEWPSAENALLMAANAGMALAFNLFFMLALAFCSPIVVSVGCTLTIPLSALVDSLVYGDDFFVPLPILGSGCVVAGFIVCTWADSLQHDKSAIPFTRCCNGGGGSSPNCEL